MKEFKFWQNIYSVFPIDLFDLLVAVFFLVSSYLTSLISYDIFHSLIEILCIVVIFGMFIIAWNARSFLDNHFLLFLSIAYIFIAQLDIAHILSYKGMNLFAFFDPTNDLPTKFWIAARYLQAFALLSAPFFLTRKINIRLVWEIFTLIIILVFTSIFYLKIFPTTYIEGMGLTPFKIWSEYIISLILVSSAVFLFYKRKMLDKKIFYLIISSIIFTIASELSFTTYFNVSDLSNMLGHLFKLISFLLLYKVVLEVGFKNPLAYIFRNMEQNAEILRASELKFRTIIKLVINPIVLTNSKGAILMSNYAAEQIFGWNEEEIINQSFAETFLENKEKKLELQEFINAGKQKKSYQRVELEGIRKNGEKFTFELSSSYFETKDESFFCFLMRDISVRKRMDLELANKSKELEKLVNDLKVVQMSMDNAFAHLVITDENGSIVYANKSAEEMTGFSKKEMLHNKPSLWGRQMSLSFYENLWKTVKYEKKNFTGEIINKRKNGDLYTAEIRISPVLNKRKEVKFFVALERDITEQKEIDKAKTEFISLAAHQLRTPLSNISITSEMLLRGIVGNVDKETRKHLKNIFLKIKDMSEMIEIFLNVSRIEVGRFPIEKKPTELFEVLEKAVKGISPQLKSKGLHLKKNYKKNLPVLNLDEKVMKIILENLLVNAVKYSKKNGKIILAVDEKNNEVTIEVKDEGIGIPEKEQSKIFTKMFRAENASSIKSEGSGLGLYMVKNLAEQSDYTISFESKENKGTTFSLVIPKKS